MKFVKVKGFEKKVAFLGVFYMCVFGESNLTVYNKCLEDLFQQKLNKTPVSASAKNRGFWVNKEELLMLRYRSVVVLQFHYCSTTAPQHHSTT